MSAYSVKAKPKKADPLTKKVPSNPKYEHVKSTLDTGASVTKYLEKVEEIRKNYRFKKDEIFKRMKLTTFAQLVVQVADHNSSEMDTPIDNGPDSYRPDTADDEVRRIQGVVHHKGGGGDTGRDTSRSTLQQVIKGIGEVDVDSPPTQACKTEIAFEECPYLLLDIRDPDDYKECHLISALSYPASNLSKATNYETKEMLAYKNAEGKIIIIYDEDEKIAPKVATTLVQRMYDNVFLLSGGLRVAYKTFPRGFLTGTPNLNTTDGKPPPKEKVMANQKNFTIQNLSDINSSLEIVLADSSSGSRLSHASTMSSRMSNTSRTSRISNKDSRPAFR